MPDYNIYIHSDPNTNGDKTKPWKSDRTPTAPKDSDDGDDGKTVANILNTTSNPDSLVALGISKVAKLIPYVAVAYAGLSLLDKTYSTIQTFNAIHSGNQAGVVKYNNFKTTLRACVTPFGTALNGAVYREQIRMERERLTLSQELLGESVINSRFGGRGV